MSDYDYLDQYAAGKLGPDWDSWVKDRVPPEVFNRLQQGRPKSIEDMNQDIYPLGQGKGLLTDILNFGLNNINKYGQRTADYHSNLTKAFQDIQSGKSPDLSPLIQDAISVNPIMAGTWGPIRTGAQKKVVKALWRADPDAVKAIATDPRELNLSGISDVTNRDQLINLQKDMTASMFMPESAAATYTPSRDVIKVAPATMRGNALYPGEPESFMGLKPAKSEFYGIGAENLPQTMKHEAQHFLNVPRIYDQGISNPDAIKMWDLLKPYLSEHAQKASLQGGMHAVDPKVALDEALAYLSMKNNRSLTGQSPAGILHELIKMKPGLEQGTTRGPALTPDVLQSAVAKAEALAPSSKPGLGIEGLQIVRDMLRKQFGGLTPENFRGPEKGK
jgi:hypothetical protein